MVEVLIVDDEKKIRHLLSIMLESQGYHTREAENGGQALGLIREISFDVVISDIKMPVMDGYQLLEEIKKLKNPVPVIFITAFATVDAAVRIMRMGADDFISKPFEEEKVIMAINRVLNVSRLVKENVKLKEKLDHVKGYGRVIAESDGMKKVLELARRVASTASTVLITGESGAGKEIIARFVHNISDRSGNRFVAVNSAAISGGLVESELFGHEKGAFTGANKQAKGKFEYADSGTLFLDEIGDLPLDAQSKLLRVLQEQSFQSVGSNREIIVDTRVICATNQDLEQLVRDEQFRKDLFYRINVFPIHIPPLRHRKDDILPLARHFMERFAPNEPLKLSEGAQVALLEYNWPGNTRELINVIERAVILIGKDKTISRDVLDYLPRSANKEDATATDSRPEAIEKGLTLEEMERKMVFQALADTQNNKTAAAKNLGITRSRFRVLLKKYES